MAKYYWAQVYYQNELAGILREESGGRFSFTYDLDYLAAGSPSIAHTLPVQSSPIVSPAELHPFFDNLVAEGWMEEAQTRLLGKRQATRFELLMAFGADCAGAVSVVDPEISPLTSTLLELDDQLGMASMAGAASLSGVQPKLALVEENNKFRPAKKGELSTYIGKFPSQHHDDLVINEYITMQAFSALLPDDAVVDFRLGKVNEIDQPALIIKRFDRESNQRIHFEEFNQLLGRLSKEKYNGAHKDMADFIRATHGTLKTEIYTLFCRILAGILLGNTDMHLKNFAMLHTPNGLRLTPSYDQVAAAIYQYKTMALKIGGAPNMRINNLKPGNIICLGEEFGLSRDAIEMAVKSIEKQLEKAKAVLEKQQDEYKKIKVELINMMEKRWNGTFALIGHYLSKKQ